MGRPPTKADQYDPIYCSMLIEHMSQGFSYESFAAKIGTYRNMLYSWEEMYPDFKDTVKRAKELCQYWWEQAGVNGLYTIVEHGEGGQNIIEKKINPTMWIFNMKARFRWRDQDPKIELSAPEKEKEVITIEDKKKLLAQAEKEIQKLREEVGVEAKALKEKS